MPYLDLELSDDDLNSLRQFGQRGVERKNDVRPQSFSSNVPTPISLEDRSKITGRTTFSDPGLPTIDPTRDSARSSKFDNTVAKFKRDEDEMSARFSKYTTEQLSALSEALGLPASTANMDQPGYQKVTKQDGTQEAVFVLPKSTSVADPIIRTGLSGASKGLKGLLSFSEQLLESVGLNDPSESWYEENFPTIATANGYEDIASDLAAVVLGGMGGAKLASKIDDAFRLSSTLGSVTAGTGNKVANFIMDFKDTLMKVDPQNAPKKLQLMFKYILGGTGANIGAGIATDPDTQSITDTITGKDTGAFGHISDNMAISTALFGVGKTFGTLAGLASKIFPALKGSDKTPAAMAETILRRIDPQIGDNMQQFEIADKAKYLSEVLDKYSTVLLRFGGGNKVKLANSSTVAIKNGAKEYMQKAYGHMSNKFNTPEEYAKFIDDNATTMVNNMIELKRGRTGSPMVRLSDALANKQTKDALNTAADRYSSTEVIDNVGRKIGEDVVAPIQSARGMSELRKRELQDATSRLSNAANNNTVRDIYEDATRTSKIGQTNFTMSGPATDRKDSLVDSLSNYRSNAVKAKDAEYAAVPSGIDWDRAGFVKLIREMQPEQASEFFKAISAPGPSSALSAISNLPKRLADGKFSASDATKAIKELGKYDTKYIVDKVLPWLSRKIDDARVSGNTANSDVYINMRQFLQSQLDDTPAYAEATSKFRQYADRFRDVPSLENFDSNAALSNSVGDNVIKNRSKVLLAGDQVINDVSNANDRVATKVLSILTEADPEATQIVSEFTLGKALKVLRDNINGSNDGSLSPTAISSAFSPYMDTLRRTNPNLYGQIENVFKNLEGLQTGARNADQAYAAADEAYTTAVKEAQGTAASKFAFDITGDARVIDAPTAGFNAIFSDPNAASRIREILEPARQAGDTEAIGAIKSQYLRYVLDKIGTVKPIAIDDAGQEVTREVSQAKIKGVMSDSAKAAMSEIYKDEPLVGDTIAELMKFLDDNIDTKTVMSNTGGSPTWDKAINWATNQRSGRAAVTALFGVLNRVATTMNLVLGAFTKDSDAFNKTVATALLDRQITDPNYLSDALKALQAGDTGTLDNMMKQLTPYLTKGAFTITKPEEDQTEEVLKQRYGY